MDILAQVIHDGKNGLIEAAVRDGLLMKTKEKIES